MYLKSLKKKIYIFVGTVVFMIPAVLFSVIFVKGGSVMVGAILLEGEF